MVTFQLVNVSILCLSPTGAFDALCDNLNSPAFESAVGASDDDINFLSNLMNSTVLQSLIQVGSNIMENTQHRNASSYVQCNHCMQTVQNKEFVSVSGHNIGVRPSEM